MFCISSNFDKVQNFVKVFKLKFESAFKVCRSFPGMTEIEMKGKKW
jgi:hypothetical protein